jgi:hypothetical protein
MSTFGIDPPSDWQEFDAAAIGAGIDLEATGGTNGLGKVIRVITAGAGALDVIMASSSGVTRTLTVADNEEIIGLFSAVRATSTVTRIRVGW